MSTLFIFGAGASYGSGPCHPSSPPLGSALFDELRAAGGIATKVSKELAEVFRHDFEAGMDRFWKEHNTATAELLRDMARYFAKFEPLQDNLYIKLVAALSGTRKKAIFATTNYDLLIEHAISQSGLLIKYGGLPTPHNNIPVLKLHGSCNFLPDMGGGGIYGIGFDLSNSDGASILDAPVRVARSKAEILDFCAHDNALAPALAMYHPSKRVLFCRRFVQQQQAIFHSAIKQAARIYLVGLRVHPVDEHIWQPLSKSRCPLFYVGQEPQIFLSWALEHRRSKAFHIASTFAEALSLFNQH